MKRTVQSSVAEGVRVHAIVFPTRVIGGSNTGVGGKLRFGGEALDRDDLRHYGACGEKAAAVYGICKRTDVRRGTADRGDFISDTDDLLLNGFKPVNPSGDAFCERWVGNPSRLSTAINLSTKTLVSSPVSRS